MGLGPHKVTFASFSSVNWTEVSTSLVPELLERKAKIRSGEMNSFLYFIT